MLLHKKKYGEVIYKESRLNIIQRLPPASC